MKPIVMMANQDKSAHFLPRYPLARRSTDRVGEPPDDFDGLSTKLSFLVFVVEAPPSDADSNG
ncbi:hypothetical protein ACFOY2_17235 [Nonomuraea purpurea]|uniref:Uncharacterized protein n=1 Tax=Nonomuraea purpurea TaxID=1849276 RepID=A0ABV8G8I1_9ACTN